MSEYLLDASTKLCCVLIVNLYCHVFAVFLSDEKDNSGFSLIAISIQTNLSGSPLEHDLQPLQIEI